MGIPRKSMVRVTAMDTPWYGYVGIMVGAVSYQHSTMSEPVDVFAVQFSPDSKFGFTENELEVVDVQPVVDSSPAG